MFVKAVVLDTSERTSIRSVRQGFFLGTSERTYAVFIKAVVLGTSERRNLQYSSRQFFLGTSKKTNLLSVRQDCCPRHFGENKLAQWSSRILSYALRREQTYGASVKIVVLGTS